MKLKCLLIVLLFMILFLPACALADNGMNVIRLIAVNSSDFLVVVSGEKDSADTPQPISTYQYVNGTIVGEHKEDTEKDNSFCPGVLAPLFMIFLSIKVFRR